MSEATHEPSYRDGSGNADMDGNLDSERVKSKNLHDEDDGARNKSTKKRRKVNHGMSFGLLCASRMLIEHVSCSMCILPAIGKLGVHQRISGHRRTE